MPTDSPEVFSRNKQQRKYWALAKRLAALSPKKRVLMEQALSEQGIDTWVLPIVPQATAGKKSPLSFAQQRLWLLHCLDKENPSYNLFGAVRLKGVLDITVLERSIGTLIERHEVLRTHFIGKGEDAVQVVDAPGRVTLSVEISTRVELSDIDSLVQSQAIQEMFAPFDLGSGSLFRLKLLALGETDHVLLITLHHIVADAWSLSIVVKEIAALYTAYRTGYRVPLADLPIQYSDYAVWQRQWLQGPVFDKQIDYWRARLAGAPRQLELPIDHPYPDKPGLNGRVINLSLDQSLSRAVRQFCLSQGLTPYVYLLAAFMLLLHRWSGEKDICVGSSIANRSRPETEGLIGFFVNMLVMRSDLSANPSVEDLLSQVHCYVLGAMEHQDLPFDQLLEVLGPERSGSHHPFFQVLFVLQNAPGGSLRLPGLEMESIDIPRRFARFHLSLRVIETEASKNFKLSLEYDAVLFESDTVRCLLDSYAQLVKAMIDHPRQRVSELSLRGLAESGSRFELGQTPTLVPWLKRIAEQVNQNPDTTALDTKRSCLSYRELEQKSCHLAGLLIEKGVGFEMAVGIYAEPGIAAVVAMLAIVRAGGYFVPIDTDWPQARCCQVIEDAAIETVVIETSEYAKELPDGVVLVDYTSLTPIVVCGKRARLPFIYPQQLAYVMYTSGSSGRPKGVAISHQSLSHYIQVLYTRLDFDPRSRVAWVSGISTDLGFTSVWGALCGGATLQIFGREQAKNAVEWMDFVADTPPDMVKITPSQLKSLWVQSDQSIALLPTRTLVLGGEKLDLELVARIQLKAPELTVINHYGPTETTVGVISGCTEGFYGDCPIGVPFAGVDAYVMDRYGQPVPDGMAGELFLGGASLARGYLGKPGQTAERFVPHPSRAGGRLYRSGDRVRRVDNRFFFLGRIDAQISLHGYRIEPTEVEAVLRCLTTVADAAVARIEREEAVQLAAYLVLESDAAQDMGSLRAQAAEHLPIHMVPTQWFVVEVLPLTSNGKLDRQRLSMIEPKPSVSSLMERPQNDLEQQLAAIWESVLNCNAIGRYDDFFALGGDSILSLQVVAQAKRAGLTLSPKQLFETPVLTTLAARLNEKPILPAETESIVDGTEIPLTPVQHWFFQQQLVNRRHWNQSLLLSVDRRLSKDKLRGAVTQLATHHDALRLGFDLDEHDWRQRYYALDPEVIANVVHYIDLRDQDEARCTEIIEARCAALQTSLSLDRPPLFCIAYFDHGDGQAGRLFIAVHHLLVDGVSWRILLDDLEALYRGEPPELKTGSFLVWSQKLIEYAETNALKEQFPKWKDLPHAVRLPRDLEGLNTQASSSVVTQTLCNKDTEMLLALNTGTLNIQVDDLLLSALCTVLCRWIDHPGVLIECEGHGRDLADTVLDVSRTVGWFTARYPQYLDAMHTDDVMDHMQGVKARRQSMAPHGIDYGVLRYLSSIGKVLASQSEPEVGYNYLGQIDKGLQATMWSKAPESAGHQRDPASLRSRLIAVNAHISSGELILNWLYSSQVHHAKTIEQLAEQCTLQILQRLRACRDARAIQCSLQFESDVMLNAEDVSRLFQEIEGGP